VNDAELLAAFVNTKSEDAFKELVRLHVGMVYSVCRRQLGDAHWAEDVTQAVFVLLARKAEKLAEDVVLGGWLYKAAVYACSNARNLNKTRKYHEKMVMPMNMPSESDPVEQAEMEALLDKGLLELSQAQREVLVLRFFESRPLTEIANMRNQSLYATQKALDSGMARLRRFMKERGVPVTAGVIVAALLAQTARAAVPVGLAGTVGSAALGGSGVQSAYVAHLVGHLMQHTGRVKLLGTLGIAASVMLAAGALWFLALPLLSAGGPGTAATAVGAPAMSPAQQTAQMEALWGTLRKAEAALRRMDAAAIAEVVAFAPRQQADWDAMAPVFAQNQALKLAGAARFGADGGNLTALKTFGERIDEILPRVDPGSFQWALGDQQATLYFAFRDEKTRGGSIYFVKEDGQWKIDAGLTAEVTLEGLEGDTRVAVGNLDETGRNLVREKMEVLTWSLTHVAERIAHEQTYDLAAARGELEAADAAARGRAFFRLALRYDNAGQMRN
jgi:RNA polymerase sigma factor (sigma-70 family)